MLHEPRTTTRTCSSSCVSNLGRTASTRPTTQSSTRSRSPNDTVPAHTQDADRTVTTSTHASTMHDADEQDPACSSAPCVSTTPERITLAASEQEGPPDGTAEVVPCALESLPVEIQTRILAGSSLDSLHAIIRSSPRFYYVYSENRLPILRKVLNRAVDDFFPEARAACALGGFFEATDNMAADAAEAWKHFSRGCLGNPIPPPPPIDDLSLEIIQQMARFHLRVVEPLTEHYSRWALGALSSSPQAAPLTRTEKSRIQRALYRLQVLSKQNLEAWDPPDVLDYLDSFGPWATEQIICVHEFAKERLSSAFIECAWELNGDENPNSRYRHAMLDIKQGCLPLYRNERLNVCTLLDLLTAGLSVLQKIFQAQGFNKLCDVLIQNVRRHGGDTRMLPGFESTWIDESVDEDQQFERDLIEDWFCEHNDLQNTQQEMLFEHDDLLSPPLAWVAFWNGRYSNLIGAYIPKALQRWGYVMWDATRLKESGAMEYIELEWQCKYGVRGSLEEKDPRDYYITAYQQRLGNNG
ncbi:hypothetical protein KVR01_013125 [Diaporthe batatas]|uniref:uncharacterized protein n=1 Tax=Diaporthe batatas TaxID=748121 RepID=UPI001D047B59|nr:uncharacterized protein KVR01_013125 [Diaporthe batatas]KAG8157135.1 hypothetical protein KVR01_013125 [Diaporthe batatas]